MRWDPRSAKQRTSSSWPRLWRAVLIVDQVLIYTVGALLALNGYQLVGTTSYSRYRGLYAVLFLGLAVATPVFPILGARHRRPVLYLVSYVSIWIVLLATFTFVSDVLNTPPR